MRSAFQTPAVGGIGSNAGAGAGLSIKKSVPAPVTAVAVVAVTSAHDAIFAAVSTALLAFSEAQRTQSLIPIPQLIEIIASYAAPLSPLERRSASIPGQRRRYRLHA